jgi:hypothetical protein
MKPRTILVGIDERMAVFASRAAERDAGDRVAQQRRTRAGREPLEASLCHIRP